MIVLNICEGELVIGKGHGIGILITGNILFLTFSLSKQAIQMKVYKTNTMQASFHNRCIGLNKWKASQDSIELTHRKQKYSSMGERKSRHISGTQETSRYNFPGSFLTYKGCILPPDYQPLRHGCGNAKAKQAV